MKNVLIIEDDERYARFLARSLPDKECTHAPDCKTARALLKSRIFDIVICDLGLPDCTREETAAWVYALLSGAVFIIVTGSDDTPENIQFDGLERKWNIHNDADVRGLVARAEAKHSGVRMVERNVDSLSVFAHLFCRIKSAA